MIKVGLDISQGIKSKARGIARYISEILPPLLACAASPENDFEPVLYARGDRYFRRRLIEPLTGGRAVRWMPLSEWLSGGSLNLFHSFGNKLPGRSTRPLTFTVHDLRVLDLDTSSSGSRLRRNVSRSAGILCLTEHGRSRLLHHFPEYDPGRIAVVPHGVDHSRFHPIDADQAQAAAIRHGLQPPFVLQLGSWFPHKNLQLSINAFSRTRACLEGLRLVFVGGGATADHRKSLDELARAQGVGAKIDWVEDIAAEDIPQTVAAASVLLQPSYYEGFALPLLEAMAVGTPGVVSDSSCLPEVSGGVWPVVRQDEADEFAAAIDAMVFDAPRREAAISAGLDRAAAFTWEMSAVETLRFFRKIAAMRP